MTFNQGMYLVAVDPAYTSRWGKEHWLTMLHNQYNPQPQKPTKQKSKNKRTLTNKETTTSDGVVCVPAQEDAAPTDVVELSVPHARKRPQVSITGHHVAAVVIGRRMFGFTARRRMNEPRSGQSTVAGLSTLTGNAVEVNTIQVERKTKQTVARTSTGKCIPKATARADTPQHSITAGSHEPFAGQKGNTAVYIPKLPLK